MNQEFGPVRGMAFEKEYTLHIGWKIFLYIFITALLFAGAYSIYTATADKNWWLLVIGLVLIAISGYFYFEIKASKIILNNGGVKRVGYFSSRELLLPNIEGYTVVQGKRLTIKPVNKSDKKISLADYTYFADAGEIWRWVTMNCRDLDAELQQAELNEIQNDNSFGFTGEERLAELKRLKQFCSYFNYAATAICIWMFAYPKPYDYAILTGLIWPLAVMFVFFLKRDVVTLYNGDNKKEAVYPSLGTALVLPVVGLFIRTLLDFKPARFADVLLPAGTVAVILAALFVVILIGAKEKARSNKTTWLTAVVFVLLYGFTAPVIVNCNFDYAAPKVYAAQVMSQRISTGKHTSYNLTLSKWGPKESEEVEVSKSLYNEVKVGDMVEVNLKPGLLKIQWFYISR
ncbi:hypothetical protein [Mucilaginibacter celer]|uniref:Uncharacterized protein n=1 Tax=Mucilaginibacter celer TaxID=2305508 RepID=A0A494VIM6_9SPHI|nr:hypothetical protein [Mucilaginibacter celer]AYL94024.1 hypothetical protein HYN43_001375 [Mucilaginibacter celer]